MTIALFVLSTPRSGVTWAEQFTSFSSQKTSPVLNILFVLGYFNIFSDLYILILPISGVMGLNLRDALWGLRNIGVTSSATLVWADAVCIDQMNVLERNKQVKLMGEIYKRAAGVAVWLGLEEHHHAHRVFANIRATVELLAQNHAKGGTVEVVKCADNDPSPTALLAALADLASGSYKDGPLRCLFHRPWFSRT